MYELGDLLKKLRGKLSLREAAKRSGLSYSYISSLENGKHPRTGAPINPTPDILKNLANAYDYPYEELMRAAGYLSEQNKIEKHPAEKLREYIDSGMSNEDIKKRMDFVVDVFELTDEEIDETISFLRWRLAERKKHAALSSGSNEL